MIKDQVTCICITYNRVELLKQAISYFAYQSHVHKDLIVLFQSNDIATLQYIEMAKEFQWAKVDFNNGNSLRYSIAAIRQTDSPIMFLEVPVEYNVSLGVKRNIGVEAAKGKYVCMWDDDDWYPETRIEHQLNFMKFSGKRACTLASILLHYKATDKFYLTGIRAEGWEGTLVCEKQIMGKYENLNKKEDTPVIHELQRKNELCIMEEPELYVYNAHQNNVSGDGHFASIINYATLVDIENYKLYKEHIESFHTN